MLEPFDALVLAGLAFAAVEIAVQRFAEDVVDQRALAASRGRR